MCHQTCGNTESLSKRYPKALLPLTLAGHSYENRVPFVAWLNGESMWGLANLYSRLNIHWVTESDNLSNMTLMCNLNPNAIKREMTTRISSSPLLGNLVQSPTSVPTKQISRIEFDSKTVSLDQFAILMWPI